MEEIARRAGVAKGTLYLYFPSKRDLYLELVLSGVRRLGRELEAEVSGAGSSARELERLAQCLLAHFWDRLAFFSLLQRGEASHDAATQEWLHHRARIRRLLEETIRRGSEAGELRPIDPLRASEMLLGMLRGAVLDRRPADTPEQVAREVVDTFLHGIARTQGESGRHGGRP
jgi:TetR/AcrR family fatty acid metabolism transcriptional regulator